MRLIQLMLGSALLTGAAVADAAAVNITSVTLDPAIAGAEWGTISPGPGGNPASVYAGRIRLAGKDLSVTPNPDVSFLTYCIDVLHALSGGRFQVMPIETQVSAATNPTPAQLTDAKVNKLAAMLVHGDPLATTSKTSAAVQLAIWELAFEEDDAAYGFADGDFRASGGTLGAESDATSVLGIAKSYLANLTSGAWSAPSNARLTVLVGDPGPNQTQLLAIVSTVPEPESWAMMILGFGLVGVVARRRRTLATA